MGISTAYLNDLVIAGHLKKRRQQSPTGFSTNLWITPKRWRAVRLIPLGVVDQLHKLDEKHYTYGNAR